MIRVSEVTIVQEPDISHIEDLVVGAIEEMSEVLAWLEQVREPNHCWEIALSALNEVTSKLDLVSLLLESSPYFPRINQG